MPSLCLWLGDDRPSRVEMDATLFWYGIPRVIDGLKKRLKTRL